MWTNPLGCTTNTYHSYPLFQALERIAHAGFTWVELCADPAWTAQLTTSAGAADFTALRRTLDRLHLQPMSLDLYGDLTTGDGVEHCRAGIALAAEMEIPIVVTSFGQHTSTDEDIDPFLVYLGSLAETAGDKGVTLAMEIHGALMASGAQGADLLQKINLPNVQMNYDTANCLYYGGVHAENDLPVALPHVAHVHLKDKIGGKGVWNFPPIGQGEIDFRCVLAILKNGDYRGPLSIEIEFTDTGWPPINEIDAGLVTSRQTLLGLMTN